MKRKYALPPEWAAAIREDSVSPGNIARQTLGIAHRITEIGRVTIRIGEHPKTDIEHMNMIDFINHQRAGAHYTKRSPTCQDCGHGIKHGEKAISYRYRRRGSPGFGRLRFIHKTCP